MRELARDLNLSPGNLTYHFPKKEDLVLALAKRLSNLNSQTIQISTSPNDIEQFLEMFRAIFRNQFQYRCLVLSLVHLIEHYPTFAAQYRQAQIVRAGSFIEIFNNLQTTGFLRPTLTEGELQRMASFCALTGRFWLSDYWVAHKTNSLEDMIGHYLALLAVFLLPFVTPSGQQQLAACLEDAPK
ncbi:MAG: TetR/AcrR family transcriptional regulator [Anaerolineae bacterium]